MAEKTFAEDLEPESVEQPVETPVEAEAPAEAQPRDEHGKFAKKGDEDEGAPPAPAEKQEFDGAATLAERRKRQEAEERARAAEARAEALERQQQQNPPPAPPDIWEDPEARFGFERQQVQQELYQQRYFVSQREAIRDHGKETVEQAISWAMERAQQDPQFNTVALSQMDPVGFAVEQYRRDQMASINPDDYAAFNQWREQQAAAPQQQVPEPVKPPPTLTGERNLGKRDGPVTTGPSTFGEILNG
jgi:hypothetical protein